MKIIDLSVPIESGMEVYPGDPEVLIEVVHTHEEHSWELRKLTMGSHTGTHVDAFSHMHAGGKTLDEIPLEHFFGTAAVVDVRETLPQGIGLFFVRETGLEWAGKIIAARPKFAGGMISADLERALLQAEIVTYTNLVNLEQIPPGRQFMFYGFPLKIKHGDGSPVRAVAVLEDE